MERKTMAYWAAQIIGWGAYYILSVALLLSSGGEIILDAPLVIWVTCSIIGSILITHIIRSIIIWQDILRANIGKIIVAMIILSTIGAVLLEVYQYFLDWATSLGAEEMTDENGEVIEDLVFEWPLFLLATLRSMILFMVWIGFYFAFTIIERVRSQEMESLKYYASMNEIELKNLRAQLNPHFLFNSLNSIRALVVLDPGQAKDAITKLSSLLRLSINMGKQGLTNVKDEMELVSSYLELEKIRFEERLEVEIKMDPNAGRCEIPPLMIQTLVENAIKHGISKSINGGVISVELKCTGEKLIGKVKNTGKFAPSLTGDGIGLANTRKRLEILYGENATFDIKQVGERVHADFEIKYSKK